MNPNLRTDVIHRDRSKRRRTCSFLGVSFGSAAGSFGEKATRQANTLPGNYDCGFSVQYLLTGEITR